MNLKTTIFLSQITVFFIVIFSLIITFVYYKKEFLRDAKERIEEEVLFYKKNIMFPLQRANNTLEAKQEIFKKIHQDALDMLKKAPKSTLEDIKEALEQKYNIPHTEIEIFLIDKSYTIYETTFKQDLHFNLSKSANISHILTLAQKDGKIHFLKRIVTDVADMKYKIYSYSKLTDERLLELSFSDNSIKSVVAKNIENIESKNVNIEIYNVLRIRNNFFYLPLVSKDQNFSKTKFYKKLKKFKENRADGDRVMGAYFSGKRLIEEKNDRYIVHTKLYEKKLERPYMFQNVVVKIDINLAQKHQFLRSIQTIFLITLLASCLILLLIFITLQNKLVKPINTITKNIKNATLIPLKEFENKKSDFFSIAKEYNELYAKLKEEIKKNKSITYIDHLTKTNNRKSFDEKLEELLISQKRYNNTFSIMLFDIDDFKKINDTYGHQKGDEVLIKIVETTKNTIRKSDYLFRLGGEEFAILFPQTELKSSKAIGDKIKNRIEEEFKVLRKESVTISGGMYEVNSDDTINSIYKKVDNFLYTAKKQGKNKIIS